MRDTTRKILFLVLTITAFLITAVGVALSHALKKTKLSDTAATYSLSDTPVTYEWRSNAVAQFALPLKTRRHRGDPRFYFDELDTRTGSTTSIPGHLPSFYMRPTSIAPNGKHMLCEDDGSQGYAFCAVSLQNLASVTHYAPTQYQPVSNVAWDHGSTHWICVGVSRAVAPHHGLLFIEGDMSSTDLRVRPTFGFPPGTNSWDEIGVRLLGESDTGHMLLWPMLDQFSPKMNGKLCTLTVATGPRPLQLEKTFTIPNRGVAIDVAFAHSSRRLAWISLDTKNPSRLSTFIGRWFPSYRHATAGYALHTSSLDGTGERLVGCLPGNVMLPEPVRTLMKWLPDGKHVSFLCQGKLWVVFCAS